MARDFGEIRPQRVVLAADVAAMPVERITNLQYQDADRQLLLDVYRPRLAEEGLAAAVFVHGDSSRDPEALRDAKDWGQYVSWGELTATRGLAAVTFTHRSAYGGHRIADVRDDIDAALGFLHNHGERLGVDISRIALVGISMGVPYAISHAFDRAADLRCAVALYGPMDLRGAPLAGSAADALAEISPLYHLQAGREPPPLFIAKAGKDDRDLNRTIDEFVTEALKRNLSIDLVTHADGQHAFDILHDSARSKQIIKSVLAFLEHHLESTSSPSIVATNTTDQRVP